MHKCSSSIRLFCKLCNYSHSFESQIIWIFVGFSNNKTKEKSVKIKNKKKNRERMSEVLSIQSQQQQQHSEISTISNRLLGDQTTYESFNLMREQNESTNAANNTSANALQSNEKRSSGQPAASACSSWLLRFFESKHFDMSIAISYLFNTKEPGVQSYLCNRLFTVILLETIW